MTLIDKIENAIISIQDRLKKPYFRIGDILEVNSELSVLNRVLASQDENYPFIYMRTDYNETELIKGREYETDITLFLVNKSKKDNYTAELRRQNEIPTLKTLADSIIRALEMNGISFETNEKQYKYYNSDENELNAPVNVVRIQINTARYELIEC